MTELDEVMVAITTGEVSRLLAGHAYCGVLEACWEVFDMRRAREWTVALSRWCEGQTDLVPYRGPCLAHRVELMRLRGDFAAAEDAYRQASRLGRPPEPGIALLWLARGQVDAAAAAVRRALDEIGANRARRAELLAALVEILLARGETAEARTAAAEVAALATELPALLPRARAGFSSGSARNTSSSVWPR
jgi:hypothetical protein